jgi:D-alanyl-D-alanine carboxypeptidase
MRPALGISFALLFAGAAFAAPTETNKGGQRFVFKTFADKLERSLNGNAVGYAFTVSYGNDEVEARSGGQARIPADTSLVMSPSVPFSAASLSKTVTAATAIQLLDRLDRQKHYQPGTMLKKPIGPYLPNDFNADEHFKEITFEQLLSHTSGIPWPGVDKYNDIRNYVRSHPNVSNAKYAYSNTNFALFRVLIPNLSSESLLQSNDPAADYAAAYKNYVQKNALDPAGLHNIPSATTNTTGLDYHFPLSGDPGMDLGDLTLELGSHGWVMSTQQLAAFLRALNHTEKIVRKDLSELMAKGCLGYDFCNFSVLDGSPYAYWAKEAFYPGCYDGNAGEFWGELVVFSNDVSVALFVNSNLTYNRPKTDNCDYSDRSPLDAIVDAFNSTIGK